MLICLFQPLVAPTIRRSIPTTSTRGSCTKCKLITTATLSHTTMSSQASWWTLMRCRDPSRPKVCACCALLSVAHSRRVRLLPLNPSLPVSLLKATRSKTQALRTQTVRPPLQTHRTKATHPRTPPSPQTPWTYPLHRPPLRRRHWSP